MSLTLLVCRENVNMKFMPKCLKTIPDEVGDVNHKVITAANAIPATNAPITVPARHARLKPFVVISCSRLCLMQNKNTHLYKIQSQTYPFFSV